MNQQTIEIPAAAWAIGTGSARVIVQWTQGLVCVLKSGALSGSYEPPREAQTPQAASRHILSTLKPDDPNKAVLAAWASKLSKTEKAMHDD